MYQHLKGCFFEERERWVLWLPSALGLGIATYFALPREPDPDLAVMGWGLLLFITALLWRKRSARSLLLVLAFMLLGFHAAQFRALAAERPVLDRDLGPVNLEARVLSAEALTQGYRVLLEEARIEGLKPLETPFRLRVAARLLQTPPQPGARFTALVGLRPPPVPSAPGDYDFARLAWFQKLGAVGFVYGHAEVAEVSATGFSLLSWWSPFWADLRSRVASRVLDALPGATGGVAVALLTGYRGAVPARELEQVRDSGLAHLLAISGLHIGLVSGMLFLVVRCGFSLWPAVVLRYPIKQIAAMISLAGAGAYLLLAGAPVPTQRAFFMTALVLAAILAGRTAISLYSIAWAAIAVLLLAPETLLSASFQMSFAAVVALVAAYDALRRRREKRLLRGSYRPLWQRPFFYLGGVLLTSLIALIAVAPMTLQHFSRLPLYSLLANLVAVPATALWVMPSALAALLLMPLGLEQPFLWLMGTGIEIVLFMAAAVAELDGAVLRLPPMTPWAFASSVMGGLWLCLWQGRWRFFGFPVILLGVLSSLWTAPPDLTVSGDGRLLALRSASGQLLFNSRRVNRFSAEQWLGRAAQEKGGRLPAAGELLWPDLACDHYGCLLRRKGQKLAVIFEGEALEEDCRGVDLLLATIPVPPGCREGPDAPALLIDSRNLRDAGGLSLWIERDGRYRLRRVAEERGERPWSMPSRPLHRRSSASSNGAAAPQGAPAP